MQRLVRWHVLVWVIVCVPIVHFAAYFLLGAKPIPLGTEAYLSAWFLMGLPAFLYASVLFAVLGVIEFFLRDARLRPRMVGLALGLLVFVFLVAIFWWVGFSTRVGGVSVDDPEYRRVLLINEVAFFAVYLLTILGGATAGYALATGTPKVRAREALLVLGLVLLFAVVSLSWAEHWNNCWLGRSVWLPPEDCG